MAPWCTPRVLTARAGTCPPQDLIKKHSEFIAYPISLWTEKTTEKEVDDDEDEPAAEAKDDEEEGKVEEVRLTGMPCRQMPLWPPSAFAGQCRHCARLHARSRSSGSCLLAHLLCDGAPTRARQAPPWLVPCWSVCVMAALSLLPCWRRLPLCSAYSLLQVCLLEGGLIGCRGW